MDAKQRIHPLDRLIADDSLFLLEAMVPFVEYKFKKPLVLFIKYRELTSIMKSLDNRDYISQCGFDCHPNSTEDMISDMCDFLPGNFASSIKQMKQMMSVMEMMNMTNGMSDMMGNMSGMQNMMNNMPGMQDMMNNMSGMQDMMNNFSANESYGEHKQQDFDNMHNEHEHHHDFDDFHSEHHNDFDDFHDEHEHHNDFDDTHGEREHNEDFNYTHNTYQSSQNASLFDNVMSILDSEDYQ